MAPIGGYEMAGNGNGHCAMVHSNSILVTGGAGYIGSHTVVHLLEEGYSVAVVDNLKNASEEAIRRVQELAGTNGHRLKFYKVDLCNKEELRHVFARHRFEAVIHFAGFKAVGESVQHPLRYYHNNMTGTITLLEVMTEYKCKKIVFSSSATVYGQPKNVPCTEQSPLQALNPYGRTKLYIEEMLRDVQKSDSDWRVILLRYFNPVGAHPSGKIGEDPIGIPNNLMPFIQQVVVGRRPVLKVFGTDYDTRDGTGVRDYIHVMDLARGHVAALNKLFTMTGEGCEAYNLGTGRGTTVLEMVAAFEKASGKKIPVSFVERRPGDASEVYASTEKAKRELQWTSVYTLEDMCRDQWKWASQNPYGYRIADKEVNGVDEKPKIVMNGKAPKNEVRTLDTPVSTPRTTFLAGPSHQPLHRRLLGKKPCNKDDVINDTQVEQLPASRAMETGNTVVPLVLPCQY